VLIDVVGDEESLMNAAREAFTAEATILFLCLGGIRYGFS